MTDLENKDPHIVLLRIMILVFPEFQSPAQFSVKSGALTKLRNSVQLSKHQPASRSRCKVVLFCLLIIKQALNLLL